MKAYSLALLADGDFWSIIIKLEWELSLKFFGGGSLVWEVTVWEYFLEMMM
jgi:hypothetical protein